MQGFLIVLFRIYNQQRTKFFYFESEYTKALRLYPAFIAKFLLCDIIEYAKAQCRSISFIPQSNMPCSVGFRVRSER